MKKEKSKHIRKPTIFPLIVMFFLLSLFCCSTPLKLENVKNEDLFSVEEIKKVKIPFSDITRSIVIIKKEKSTPSAFPRTAKKIKG